MKQETCFLCESLALQDSITKYLMMAGNTCSIVLGYRNMKATLDLLIKPLL